MAGADLPRKKLGKSKGSRHSSKEIKTLRNSANNKESISKVNEKIKDCLNDFGRYDVEIGNDNLPSSLVDDDRVNTDKGSNLRNFVNSPSKWDRINSSSKDGGIRKSMNYFMKMAKAQGKNSNLGSSTKEYIPKKGKRDSITAQNPGVKEKERTKSRSKPIKKKSYAGK